MINGLDKTLRINYNLQFFAEGDSGGEKTEQPTQKRKEKAREEGQVAKSNEVTTAFLFIIMFTVLKIYGPTTIEKLILLTKNIYALFSIEELTISYSVELMRYILREFVMIMLPIFLVALLVGIICNFIQVGWNPTMKPLTPKLSNLSPISGFKRLFSLRSVIELIKALLKILIILIIVLISLYNYEDLLLTIYTLSVLDAYRLIMNICMDIGIKVGAFFIIIAVIDYIYQKYSLNKKLKMTKQEVKDEYKQTEGNPEIKSKIKQKMREAAMRRMMQDLPNADVIITNPTHFAVAVRYDQGKQLAPIIIAKGADLIAAKIKEIAKENDTPIVENKPLARTLYYAVEIGDEIPPELYQAVAEVLAFVYNLKKEGVRA